MLSIPSSDLVAFAEFTASHPIRIDLVYANARHPENIFNIAIYKEKATCWGHKDMVKIVLAASEFLKEQAGKGLVVKDCLRPVEAQALMETTEIVRQNPQWMVEPRFLSPPGKGGHPRAMAVDVTLYNIESGHECDMGTGFDNFTNLAARHAQDISAAAIENRKLLENAMMQAAENFNLPLLPLPNEWWDFRFPASYTNNFAPLHEADLLPQQRMTAGF